MTNLLNKKLCSIASLKVQNDVHGGGYYLLTNFKLNSFLHEIKWIGEVYPFFCCVIKGGRNLCKKNKQY